MSNTLQTHSSADGQTMEDCYQRAQTLMQGIWTNKLTFNDIVYPFWIGDSDCFWYVRTTKTDEADSAHFGQEFRLVDANLATNSPAFDHQVIAAALEEAAQQTVDASDLPITQVDMQFDSALITKKVVKTVHFTAFDQRWVFDSEDEACTQIELIPDEWEVSPDRKHAVFIRDFNLWVRELDTGKERALTSDGEEDYIYGLAGRGWGVVSEPRVQARWSADSKRLFTVQHDERQVKALPVVHHVPKDGSLRPTVELNKIAYPGDEHIATLRLLCIDVETGRIQNANYRQIPVTRNSLGLFSSNLAWWASDSCRAYFVDVERDYKTVRVIEFNTDNGEVKELFKESTDTQINLMLNGDEQPTFRPLPDSGELLWFSERSGWAHLYLYDLESGELKNVVTKGDWVMRQVVHVDPVRREAFIQTAGRVPERDPYYRDLCRVHLDTGEITPLVSSDHEIVCVTYKDMDNYFNFMGFSHDLRRSNGVSPTGKFVVVTQSRANEVSSSFLVDRQGKTHFELEVTDTSGLPSTWRWPEPFKILAADDHTDLYGLVYRPSDFSPEKSYPVLVYAHSTPDFPIVSKGSFSNGFCAGGFYLEASALAELGFIVVQLDTRGAAYRSKALKDESYGWVESACNFDDCITGIRQLAERYSSLDLNRVGIVSLWGGPGGLQGLLQHPEFFKVGVSNQLHDSRLMSAPLWGEQYEGITGPDEEYQYPETIVENLKGKLLLINGMLDTTTPPACVFRVVEALQKANKDFDLLLLPNHYHEGLSYVTRRTWDFLVKHLLETEPPKEFSLKVTGFGD